MFDSNNILGSTSGGGGGGSGTVTSVSVVNANGFDGTVANASTTPAITIETTVTGIIKGDGTAISAAVADTDYLLPTSGTSLSGFNNYVWIGTDGTGNLTNLTGNSVDTNTGGMNQYLIFTPPVDAGGIFRQFNRYEGELDMVNNTTQTTFAAYVIDSHSDRTGSGGDFLGQFYNQSSNQSLEGTGTHGDVYGWNFNQQAGVNTNAGTCGAIYAINFGTSIGDTYTAGSYNFINSSLNISATATLTGNVSIINHGLAGVVGGNYIAANYNVNGDILGNYNGELINVNGDVTGGIQGYSFTANGTSNNFQGYSVNYTGNCSGNVNGLSISGNGSSASYGGISVNYSGASAAGVVGAQINVETATTGDGSFPQAITFGGAISGGMTGTIPSGGMVLTGNNFAFNAEVQSGTPVTGTDFISNNLSSSLYAQDDLVLGPIGLGWSCVGFVGQAAVTSGSTVDAVNWALSGFSFPAQSTGGTITDATLYRAVGAFSAGGTLNITNLYGLKVDAGFSTGGTTTYGVWVGDPATLNHFAGNVDAGSLSLVNGSFSSTLQAGVQAGNITYTLPTAAPAVNGYVLTSTTAGVMSWAAGGSVDWSDPVNADIVPDTDDAYEIGSVTNAFQALFLAGQDGNNYKLFVDVNGQLQALLVP